MEKKIDNFFNDTLSLIILLIISLSTIYFSNNLYVYEDALSLQDSKGYILLAEDPLNYLYGQHQESLRALPSMLVFLFKFTGLSTEACFKILTFFFFILLHFKIFYLFKAYMVKNYLSLTAIAILLYSNHAVIYTVFNYYQLVDLITYIVIIYFIELHKNYNLKKLFLVSMIAMFTKEYLLILVFTLHIKYFISHYDKKIIISLLLTLLIFILHYNLAAHYTLEIIAKTSVINLIKGYTQDYNLFIQSMINSLVLERNIFLFFPFVLFFFSHKFLLYLKRYFLIIIFVTVPLGFSIFLFHNVGNNFFRVFYHGYFIVILFSLLFLFAEIKKNDISQILIFISPLFFLIDFIYIFNNINQDGFFNFFQVTRYQFLSGYFFFNIIIILVLVMNLKNLFIRISNKKYEK
jgi:hypothetical protein